MILSVELIGHEKTNYQEAYKVYQENNQLVLILNSEILLPENDPVRVTSAQLEEVDYRKLRELPELEALNHLCQQLFFLALGFNLKMRWMK